MTELAAYHFETGENHAVFANLDSSPPALEEVTSTGAIGGNFSKHLSFNSSDYYHVSPGFVYNRAAATTAMLMAFAVQFEDLPSMRYMQFSLASDRASGSYYPVLWFSIGTNGAISCYRACQSAFPSTTYTFFELLGTTDPGVITAGARHFISARGIIDDTVGEVQLEVDGAVVLSVAGDTRHNSAGPADTGWGWSIYFGSISGVSGVEVWLDDFVIAEDEAAATRPRQHAALVPDGVTADNAGTVFGGAADAAAATDEIPGTSADGFTLDAVGIQGLTFGAFPVSGATIHSVQAFGQVGDSAAGAETVVARLGDGTTETADKAIPVSASFVAQPLTDLLDQAPSGGDWTETLVNASYVEIERTS